MKKKTTEEFIEQAKIAHGSEYEYNQVDYHRWDVKVLIKHIMCGYEFKQAPQTHLSGHGCPKCANDMRSFYKKKTTEEFVKNAKIVHGDLYNYDEVIYQRSAAKVLIKHVKCGYVFNQRPNDHLHGHGCPKCANNIKGIKMMKTINDFVENAKIVHGNLYDYNDVVYQGSKVKVSIKHVECGYNFNQTPGNHLAGQTCPHCAHKIMGIERTKTTDEFIKRAKIIHGDSYGYEKVVYRRSAIKVTIKHIECGKEFNQTPSHHLNGGGCPKCKSSKGELFISRYLDAENIDYVMQKRFPKCKNINTLPFDFYIPSWNVCIEYDGIQHDEEVEFFGGADGFEQRKINDRIKDKYCADNDILLERIKHDEKIEDSMDELFLIYSSHIPSE